ncbi:MAG: alpha/beta hydrolase [Flavobacteriaceae bacterium]
MKTHIYFVPGLGANTNIFKYIKLPEDKFELHYLNWIIPTSIDESIADYAKRMCESITEKNVVLVGVSFGGIMVQEMSKHINPKKIFLISSVKTRYELPSRMLFTRISKSYKLFPASHINRIEKILIKIFGKKAEKRIQRYNDFLSIRNPLYLKWAIKNVVHWSQTEIIPNITHIHGDTDEIFPIKNINDCIVIKRTGHLMMTLKKGKTISNIIDKTLSKN